MIFFCPLFKCECGSFHNIAYFFPYACSINCSCFFNFYKSLFRIHCDNILSIRINWNIRIVRDYYYLHIDQIEGELCIRMDRSHKDYVRLFDMMLQWYEERKKGDVDFESSMAYEEWKLNYPPTKKR